MRTGQGRSRSPPPLQTGVNIGTTSYNYTKNSLAEANLNNQGIRRADLRLGWARIERVDAVDAWAAIAEKGEIQPLVYR